MTTSNCWGRVHRFPAERLDRREDVVPVYRALSRDEPLAKDGLIQHQLEDRPDSARGSRSDGQRKAAVESQREAAGSRRPIPTSCRSRWRDHEVPEVPAPTLGTKGLEDLELKRFGGDVDGELGRAAAPLGVALGVKRGLEPISIGTRVIRLELGLLPILLEGRGDPRLLRVVDCCARTFHSSPSRRAECVRFEEPT